ncbi:MAG: DUF4159 domain-containing protein [Tepidisphaeraceae bacterium]
MTRRSASVSSLGRLFLAGSFVVAVHSKPAHAASADAIDAAVRKGVAYLYSRQKNARWEAVDVVDPSSGAWDIRGGQWGGKTALITYALLASGESPNEERIKPTIDFLRGANIIGYYAIGMRAQMYQFLPSNNENKDALEKEFTRLYDGLRTNPSNRAVGTYDYLPTQLDRVDLSVTQYGVLGMWAVAQLENAKIAQALERSGYWQIVENAWLKWQDSKTGGWAYEGRPTDEHPYVASITAAGVASLFITQDYLHASEGINCQGNISNAAIDKGMDYLSKSLPELVGNGDVKNRHYTLYGIERVGVASGLKYFDKTDWYSAGADYLVRTQRPDGSWAGSQDADIVTAFSLLFLSRGREPVMMNKLQYQQVDPRGKAKPVEGLWNQRPRDVANVARWVGKQIERHLNWQIVNLDVATLRDFHDAPILYIAGGAPLQLAKEQREKLKAYVESGGMLVFNPDCNKRTFTQSARDMLTKGPDALFPGYEWVKVATTTQNPILTNQIFSFKGKRPPSMSILTNKVRTLAVLFEEDVARPWQLGESRRDDQFQIMADVYQYAVDKTNANVKGRTFYVEPDAKAVTTSTIKIARLKHNANWDPEPGGWRRLSALFRNTRRTDLQTETIDLGKTDLSGFKLAHLTGTDKFTLDAASVEQLKNFIDAGGTLLVDVAGGGSEFRTSIEAELRKIVPDAGQGELGDILPLTHELFTAGGLPKPTIRYRTFAQNSITGPLNEPHLRGIKVGGRYAILYSAEDLSAGLVGNPVDGVNGYTPDCATDLVTRIVLFTGR